MFSVVHGIEGRERIAANRSSRNPQYSLARKNDAKFFLLNGELVAVITGDQQNQGGLTSFQFLPVRAFAAIRLVMKLEMELFELSRGKQLRRHTYWSSCSSFFLATIACFAGMISMLEEAEDASLEVVFFSQRIVCVHWVLL
ncbi:unnamed protein product [Sphagnum compactum]